MLKNFWIIFLNEYSKKKYCTKIQGQQYMTYNVFQLL